MVVSPALLVLSGLLLLAQATRASPQAKLQPTTGLLAQAPSSRCFGAFVDRSADLPLTGVYFSSVAWGDYDQDGDSDILLAGRTSDAGYVAQVYRNDGDALVDIGAELVEVAHGSVAWADYDRDGDLDILLTGQGAGSTPLSKIYRNDHGAFVEVRAGLTGVAYSSALWGDWDGDGDPDLLLAGQDDSGTPVSKLYRNDGQDAFVHVTSGLIGVQDGSAAWADYDLDGDLDLLLCGDALDGDYVTKLYRNDGSSGDGWALNEVAVNPFALTGVRRSALAWGDYDQDGDPDILLTGEDSLAQPVATVYRNDGGDVFVNIQAGLTGMAWSSAAWGDYDNDGLPDILLTGNSAPWVGVSKVYHNNGGGSFSEIPSGLTGVGAGSVAWGDVDRDGDLDILLSGLDAGAVPVSKIYRSEDCTRVGLVKTSSVSGVQSGGWVTYTLTFSNSGALSALNVSVTDPLPVELSEPSFVSGGVMVTPTASAPYSWQVQDLGPGRSGTITVTARVLSACDLPEHTLQNVAELSYQDLSGTVHRLESWAAVTVLPGSPPSIAALELSQVKGCMDFITYTARITDSDGVDTLSWSLSLADGARQSGGPGSIPSKGVLSGSLLLEDLAFSGPLRATLTVTDQLGCAASRAVTVAVNQPPSVGALTLAQPGGCSQPSMIHYNATAADGENAENLDWQLAFVGGGSVRGRGSLIEGDYTLPGASCGAIQATLTVTDDHGCAVAVTNDSWNLNQPPRITRLSIGQPNCSTNSITYTARFEDCNGKETVSWQLDFSDGGRVTGRGAPIQGNYRVSGCSPIQATLTLTDDHGCSISQASTSLDINRPPTIGKVTLAQTAGCSDAITYTAAFSDCDGLDTVDWQVRFADGGVVSGHGAPIRTVYSLRNPASCEAISATLVLTDDLGCTASVTSLSSAMNQPPSVLQLLLSQPEEWSGAVSYQAVVSDCNGLDTLDWRLAFSDGGSVQGHGSPIAGEYVTSYCGRLSATLTVSDSYGCTAGGTSNVVELQQTAIPRVSLQQPNACQGVVRYAGSANTCAGSPLPHWQIEFSDGGEVSGSGSIWTGDHALSNSGYCGSITATLTVTDSTGWIAGAASNVLNVNQPPSIQRFSLDQPGGCPGPVAFVAGVTDCDGLSGLDWRVRFSDGGAVSGTGAPISGWYDPAQPNCSGEFSATLTITDTGGCAQSTTHVLGAQVTLTMQQGPDGYSSVRDATIQKYPPDSGFCLDATLWVGFRSEIKGLIRFDLSSVPSKVSLGSATLRLYATAWRGGGSGLGAYALLRTFEHCQSNWNQAQSGAPWNAAGCSGLDTDRRSAADSVAVGSGAQRWYELNLRSVAVEWLNGSLPNRGLLLEGLTGDESTYIFASSQHETVAWRPQFVLTYRPVVVGQVPSVTPPQGTITPTPSPTPTFTRTPLYSPTPTNSLTPDAGATATATRTPTRTSTPSPSATVSATATRSPTPTRTPTATRVPGRTVTITLQQGRNYLGCTDTYIHLYSADKNFSAEEQFRAGYKQQYSALIRFGLAPIPSGATILNARLLLYATGWSTAPTSFGAYAILRPNNLSQATWKRATTTTLWKSAGCNSAGIDRRAEAEDSFSPDSIHRWYGMDVTGLVEEWVHGDLANYGLLLRSTVPGDVATFHFASADYANASLRPKLVVTYR